MDQKLPKLTKEQWDFLAVLDAFGGPARIEVLGAIVPLSPGPLFDLFGKTEKHKWILRLENDELVLGEKLPTSIRKKLNKINDNKHFTKIVDRIILEGMDNKIAARQWLHLLEKAGRLREAGEIEVALAHHAYSKGQQNEARDYLTNAVNRLIGLCGDASAGGLFLSATLDLSNICFALGRGFRDIEKYLLKAQEVADKLGDRRSQALINLHLGRLYYFSDRRDDAIVALSVGFEEIQEIGDDDIIHQSAFFVGLFHFIKGLFKEAVEYFEKAEQLYEIESSGIVSTPTAPIFMGYCTAFLGQFHRAIGSLDFNWRLAVERSDPALASTIRSVLGTFLVLMRKNQKASYHLQQARLEAIQCNNSLGLYFANAGIGLQHFMAGRKEEAYEISRKNIQEGTQAGLIRQFASPWALEMAYEFHRLGFPPIPGIEYAELIERILDGVNIHLRGVALRLIVNDKMAKDVDRLSIESNLAESEICLQQSGDPVQLSKTLLEMARLELNDGNQENARRLCQKGRRLLGGYADEFFPNEFRSLIDPPDEQRSSELRNEAFLEEYLEMIESLYPSENRNEILSKVLIATNRMFGAERSGLFWFPRGRFTSKPELRAACNLSEKEFVSKDFKEYLEMIHKTYETNQAQVKTQQTKGSKSPETLSRSVLCIPIEVQGSAQGVLYFDNSYLDDAFDFINPVMMKQLVSHTNLVIERRLNYLNIEKQKNILVSEKYARLTRDTSGIISQSKIMTTMLKQVDQIAPTESTVLILGETGAGKELFAKRIHQNSQRPEGPFIVVDSTTIPENLLESELFGHERGAFTGADQQKIGQLEIAHKGTLFMDEIGELPLKAQAKLLRALQEKTFRRVGGTKTIASDFRLVAATNRNLAKEVSAGRFRGDLFYRLNVIPIYLPPLRERGEDILLLAKHFLKTYAGRYQRKKIRLTAEQEKKLIAYPWPGNIRELKNVMERAVLLSDDRQLELNLPREIQKDSDSLYADCPSLEEMQRRYIYFILKKTGGKIGGQGGAAEFSG